MVLALAIAITLGLVLGPLLKHDGSKEPTGPNDPKEPIGPTTLNVLDYYEDEKVVMIGKFTEQSLSQEIAIGDNNKQNSALMAQITMLIATKFPTWQTIWSLLR